MQKEGEGMLTGMGILLVILIIYAGRMQSRNVLLSLVMNAAVLFGAVILMIFRVNPILLAWVCFFGISIITLFYQNGVNSKTVAAFLALIVVVLLLSAGVWFLCNSAGICGLNGNTKQEDEVAFLDMHIHVNMVQVTYLIILLGLLGSVKDSAMAVATGTYEVFRDNPGITRKELFRSGMQIGRNILGVTINTLLFAAAGESVLMFHMYCVYQYSFAELINSKSFFQEMILMLAGGIGVELAVPITAFILGILCI